MIHRLVSLSNSEWHKYFYYYSSYLTILLIALAYTGIVYINPSYILLLQNILLYYVCAILLIRFNPYVKKSHVAGHFAFDRKIAFSAGLILFTTITGKKIAEYVSMII